MSSTFFIHIFTDVLWSKKGISSSAVDCPLQAAVAAHGAAGRLGPVAAATADDLNSRKEKYLHLAYLDPTPNREIIQAASDLISKSRIGIGNHTKHLFITLQDTIHHKPTQNYTLHRHEYLTRRRQTTENY
jgi:hypothetical protein